MSDLQMFILALAASAAFCWALPDSALNPQGYGPTHAASRGPSVR